MSGPNILVVMADQLAPHFTGAYGHPLVSTPAMDALAERGARFDAAYCHSPLCAPARFTMLSGQPVSAIGAWDNAAEFPASVPTIAHYLTLAGYRTCLSGKMHFVGPDQLHGFDERLTTDIYPADFAWTPNWDEADTRIGKWYHNMDSLSEAGQALATYQIDYDEEVGFAAVRRLYDLARDTDERPFFLVASFIHPHDPYVARPEWWDLYDHGDIDLPEPMPDGAVDPHTRRIRRGIEADTVGYTDDQCRNARHGYYANTSYFDSWVGRLVQVLDETGRIDDTVVIATSDHGDMLGDRGTFFKMSFFERSARVPLIMAGPDVTHTTVSNVCSHLDLLPTLLDIATGGDWPVLGAPIAGRSLWEAAAGGRDSVDEATGEYMAEMTSHPMFMIRRGRHKYIHCDADPALLYDVEADPQEHTNLADDPDHAALSAAFAAETARRWDSAGIRERVLCSQRSRRVLHAAATSGSPYSWDYNPARDASNEYVRNHMDWAEAGPRSRYPRLD
ncbi:MAG: choline-sulfatase [Acidimicrobiaceae bacterium]|nr:choline-sulfatase [Acidimicrobiaceae bacterium]MCY3643605.1 choline-sulfatase [Acidimicrobiaceae bacterium]MDE0495355.1 choline-sulfatase [Acidimicrobiaceae bacterium]MDE0665808.1 choline-sulfatase [Acidimicrobiaceae bacterium]MXW95885.1 choline-sulfatase [Acidimicrobiaceae bacterium]